MNQRELFLKHVAQTSPAPLALEIVKAEGVKLYDKEGNYLIDLIGGISVANIGHRHPKVIAAVQKQLDAYLHIMVYGEFVESPQVNYAHKLVQHLPAQLNSVYFTNSGAEATEGAMKLAKRVTGRTQIIAFKNAYHGSTQGALSIMGDEYWRNAYRPLLPDILHVDFNSQEAIDAVTEQTACIILETIHGEAGVIAPKQEWIKALREKCNQTGTLLILDEIQAGFGRTGKLWAFENYGIEPDVLLLGKALGGGMPLGAFITDKKMMDVFTENPVLGHITTFGGHPVSCAAGLAGFEVLLDEKLMEGVAAKASLFKLMLVHPMIKEITAVGLWMAVHFQDFDTNKKVIDKCIERGVFTDWFLYASDSFRICPPLNITEEEIKKACDIILSVLNEY